MQDNNTDTAKADDLRLQGNDAFGTGDYERALELYQESAAACSRPIPDTAKIYTNMATTLNKLGRYEEASKAAERATALNPQWAKAWWRRGTTAELLKEFVKAHNFYEIATDLAPKEKSFENALKDIQKRIKLKKGPGGMHTMERASPAVTLNEVEQVSPAVKAWRRVEQLVGGNYLTMYDRFIVTQRNQLYPTSLQWLFHGFNQWIGGMKDAIAQLTLGTSREATMQWRAMNQQQQFASVEEACLAAEPVLGGYPDGHPMENLFSGFAHLGGLYIVLETGESSRTAGQQGLDYLCPQPTFLSRYVAYQALAALFSIEMAFHTLLEVGGFGRNIKICRAVLDASRTLFANMGAAYPHKLKKPKQDPTPKEMVTYIKQQLQAGKTWDGGLRRLVSLNFRGTILYAGIVRLMMGEQLAESYKWERWAHKFMNLADQEFKVTEEKTYDEKGSAFRPSLRIGTLMSQLQSLEVLRAGQVNGPYSMEMALDSCVEISEMAQAMETWREGTEDIEYMHEQDDVAFRRKPLALAHSAIAAHLNVIVANFSLQDFKQIAAYHGFIESIESECDPYSLIAEHYLIAAENELPDARDGAILWWGSAAAMAQADLSSGYTLGELRKAISMAEAAEEARDIGLFGENEQRGGSFETIAKITADYFRDESDAFVIPKVNLNRKVQKGKILKASLEIGSDIICPNFDEYEKAERMKAKKNRFDKLMDTSDIQRKHGASYTGLPTLETLCIRALHKSGCEFAKGETDGPTIHYKAMLAASQGGTIG